MSAIGVAQTPPARIGTRVWHGLKLRGVEVASAYESDARGAARLTDNSIVDDVWRQSFGREPSRMSGPISAASWTRPALSERIRDVERGVRFEGAATEALTVAERRLRVALRISALVFALETLAYLLPAFIGSTKGAWIQLPFVASSVSKAALLAGVAWVAGADVRRFSPAVPIIYIGTGAWVLAAAAMLAFGDTGRHYDVFGLDLSITAILWLGIGLESSLTGLFWWLHRSAHRARYRLEYLAPIHFRTLEAMAGVLVAARERPLGADEVAANVDRYLRSFKAQRKWIVKLALVGLYLYPLLTLRPPMPLMSPAERLGFLKKRFLADVSARRLVGLWRALTQAGIRLGAQLSYVGYYGDPRTFELVGYEPFSQRERYPEALRKVERGRPKVRATKPADVPRNGTIDGDVVVIGSGAAGSILAYRLAQAERDVLLLERGQHVDPETEFGEDEVEQICRLYSDGALQLSRDFRFQVLQGMCVGGSTVVNNAVCFKMPPGVLRHWNEELKAGLDEGRVWEAFEAVRKRLKVSQQPSKYLNPGAGKFTEGIEILGLRERMGIVEANIAGCIGCGYCNIGCRFGKKLSMLDTVLPEGQRDFGERLRILAECRVDGIETEYGRARAVHCRLGDGRKLKIAANTVVVSAGAVNSSYLLQRSGIGGPVGEHLCFNMASPITAEFDEELRSYDGLQISHYFDPGEGGRFVVETWFNPTVAQALTMPGWFEDHYRNMRRYAHMTASGVLVGTQRNARVRKALTGGPDIVYEPLREDLDKLIEGIKLVGRIYLAADARAVMPSTYRFHSFSTEKELDRLDRLIRDSSDISLGTGHPQGGNAISTDPELGVVDPSFRVHGFRNLYVCDASVFPSSLTVNPQMTVMALAEYAAAGIE
jgi:choline dehydrogenase-like flavoprotein